MPLVYSVGGLVLTLTATLCVRHFSLVLLQMYYFYLEKLFCVCANAYQCVHSN